MLDMHISLRAQINCVCSQMSIYSLQTIRTARLARMVTAAGQLDVARAAWIYHTHSEDEHDTFHTWQVWE